MPGPVYWHPEGCWGLLRCQSVTFRACKLPKVGRYRDVRPLESDDAAPPEDLKVMAMPLLLRNHRRLVLFARV